jgi:hypothetical protein
MRSKQQKSVSTCELLQTIRGKMHVFLLSVYIGIEDLHGMGCVVSHRHAPAALEEGYFSQDQTHALVGPFS